MDADELRELQERAELVAQLSSTQGWGLLIDRARVTIAGKQTRLVQGKASDYEDYLKECSFLQGMEFVFNLPTRIAMELETAMAELKLQEDEEEEQSYAPA